MGYIHKVLLLVSIVIIVHLLYSYYGTTEEYFSNEIEQRILLAKHNCSQEYKKKPCRGHEIPPSYIQRGRISEIKCSEYLWKRRQLEKCEEFQRKRVLGIIGGNATPPGDIPHMAAIGWRSLTGGWMFKCGATLISEKFLVTAAHCTKSRSDPLLYNLVPQIVRLGVVYLERSINNYPVDVNISRIIKHPKYKSPAKYYDIALLKLEDDVEFSDTIQPACLWSKLSRKELDRKVVTLGWGITNFGTRSPSSVLRSVSLFLIDSDLCKYLLQPYTNRLWTKLMDHQLCAGQLKGGMDACQGDSGGPLLVPMSVEYKMHYLVGVTSFGFGCARQNVPGLYTGIANFIDWIEQNVWQKEYNERK